MNPFICPCCGQPAADPGPDAVAFVIGATPLQARLLRAVWRGKGEPVPVASALRTMYLDCDAPADGYLAFKVALHHLRRKLRPLGIVIENAGYGCGYKLLTDDRQANGLTFRAEPVSAGAERRAV